jgi:hypothetical protein
MYLRNVDMRQAPETSVGRIGTPTALRVMMAGGVPLP